MYFSYTTITTSRFILGIRVSRLRFKHFPLYALNSKPIDAIFKLY